MILSAWELGCAAVWGMTAAIMQRRPKPLCGCVSISWVRARGWRFALGCVPAHGWRLKSAELGTGPVGLPVDPDFCKTCMRVSLVLCPAIQDLCG